MSKYYRLAGGGTTTDPDEYSKSWHDLGLPLEKIFGGYVLAAFDPVIRLDKRETTNGTYRTLDSVDFSVSAAKALISFIDEIHPQGQQWRRRLTYEAYLEDKKSATT